MWVDRKDFIDFGAKSEIHFFRWRKKNGINFVTCVVPVDPRIQTDLFLGPPLSEVELSA